MTKMQNDYNLLTEPTRKFLDTSHRMYIDGQFVDSSTGESWPVYDPANETEIARVPCASKEDVDKAVAAARRALENPDWCGIKPATRERMILKLADLLEANAQEFTEIEAVNSGRLLMATRLFDVDLSVDGLRYMAGWATKIHGKTVDISAPYMGDAKFFAYTKREPVGVVAGITPWNVPLGQAIWKLAPVLATGSTVVLKPSEITPLTALRFARLVEEAGIPRGVVNIITGPGDVTGDALINHPGIDKISFTGSTATGRKIAQCAASSFKKVSLELGGKSPVIVLDDADLDVAIPGAAMAIFGNHGQNCCAGSRLFVHESVYDRVIEGISEIAENIRLGPALDADADMGPLVSDAQQQKVLGYIESGKKEGAELFVGGGRPDCAGFYVNPTVVGNVNADMRMVREEIFGPVLVATPFSEIDDAIRMANDTDYGLGASVWTRNLNRAHNIVPRLQAGMTWVNTHNVLDLAVPFGGVKHSGIGHELSEEAINAHTQIKSTIMQIFPE